MKNKKMRKNGFVAMLSLIMLILLAITGISYWVASHCTADMIYSEAMRIKARNYAQAGIEVVKTNILNSYSMIEGDDSLLTQTLSYKAGPFSAKVSDSLQRYKDFGDGYYRVVSVLPYKKRGAYLANLPHVVKNTNIGRFDIWEVIVEGAAKPSSVKAQIRAILKVYRDDKVY